MFQRQTIVILTAGGLNPSVVINALSKKFDDLHVIFETPESKWTIFKRRARLCGPIAATGQLMTMIASRLGKRLSKKRIDQIIDTYQLSTEIPPQVTRTSVDTINSTECLEHIETLNPVAIISVSCRIVQKRYLEQMRCPVINLHAGINPTYRGQMGGYWSLVGNDHENFGATIHLVDSGIDTGATLYEARVQPSKNDTLSTYPLLLTAAAIPYIETAIEDVLSSSLSPQRPKSPAAPLRYPPTIWTWFWHGLTKGIW